MKNINYIQDGEYLTCYVLDDNVGAINRPVKELSDYVELIVKYLKLKEIKPEDDKTIEWSIMLIVLKIDHSGILK